MPRKYIVPDISSVSLFKEKEKISQRWNSLELSVPKKGLQEKKKISSTKFCAWLQKLHDTLKVFQYLPYNYKYVNKSCFRCFFCVWGNCMARSIRIIFFIIYTCIKIIKKGLHLKHIHMYITCTFICDFTHTLRRGEHLYNVSGYVPFVFISYKNI